MTPPPIFVDAQVVSGITGSISLACWIIVFAPQIYENFIRKSSDGLSLLFVVLWLAGDVFNVLGAVLQKVLPTMTILAIYYTLADIVLLWQCLKYGNHKVDAIHLSPANPLSEEAGLENVLSSDDTAFHSEDFQDVNGVSDASNKNQTFYNVLMVALVLLSGILGWAVSGRGKNSHPAPELVFDPLAQFFGWLCAVLYLGSRIPQILLNFERKSCEGVSFMFFLFACLGNMTYVVSILSVNMSKNYLVINASWLAGSIGTLALDLVIFCQFFLYNESDKIEEERDATNYGSI